MVSSSFLTRVTADTESASLMFVLPTVLLGYYGPVSSWSDFRLLSSKLFFCAPSIGSIDLEARTPIFALSC